jgi:hypothetical protein
MKIGLSHSKKPANFLKFSLVFVIFKGRNHSISEFYASISEFESSISESDFCGFNQTFD